MDERLAQAIEAQLQGDSRSAAHLCRSLLVGNLPPAETWALLGDALACLGEMTPAIEAFRRSTPRDGNLQASDHEVEALLSSRRQDWQKATALRKDFAVDGGRAQGWNLCGNALTTLGYPGAALTYYDHAVKLNPQYVSGHYNRGAALLRLDRPVDALAAFDRVIALAPTDGDAYIERGNTLLDLGRVEDAVASYDHAITMAPRSARAQCNRGIALSRLHRFEDALASFHAALEAMPDFAMAHDRSATALRALGRLGEARAAHDRAVVAEPNNVAFLTNRGDTLAELGDLEGALVSYERAIAVGGDRPDLHDHCGTLLLSLRRHEAAMACFDRALAIAPQDLVALTNRGVALLALQRPEDARASCSRALALDADLAGALVNRATALRELGRFDEALADIDRVLSRHPESIEALANRGLLLRDTRRFVEAAATFARLLELRPDHEYAFGDMATCQLQCSDWRDYERNADTIAANIASGRRVVLPFAHLAISRSSADELACARIFAVHRFPADPNPLWSGERYQHNKIRIAYLSADFHDHATAYLMAELFELHDRQRFEISAVSFGPAASGEMRERLVRAFDAFIDAREMPDSEIAALLRSREIDIAVDLKGYTRDCRPGILCRRPAPIQVSYLGYPGTLGADYIDYIVADATVIPFGDDAHYAERVVRLPECYQVNDSRRVVEATIPVRDELGLPPHAFVFCCFNNNYKITPPVFDVWMRLLRAIDGSVLWLYESYPPAMGNLRVEASRRGVDPGRLVFAPRAPLAKHLARHQAASLFLDTLPVNAHTTASDALWAGLPVVTCLGNTFAGRVGASLLRAAGLADLVTGSLRDYEALAIDLARNPQRLRTIRDRLVSGRRSCALFNADRFRRHLEASFEQMWERYQRGESPTAITIPKS